MKIQPVLIGPILFDSWDTLTRIFGTNEYYAPIFQQVRRVSRDLENGAISVEFALSSLNNERSKLLRAYILKIKSLSNGECN